MFIQAVSPEPVERFQPHTDILIFSTIHIDELIRFWGSWGQKSRSDGINFDLPNIKFIQDISPQPVERFQPNIIPIFTNIH